MMVVIEQATPTVDTAMVVMIMMIVQRCKQSHWRERWPEWPEDEGSGDSTGDGGDVQPNTIVLTAVMALVIDMQQRRH